MGRYFDYNASTPVHPEVAESVAAALAEEVGNPSSLHSHGRRARRIIDRARGELAALLTVEPERIVFTSGATEANNHALRLFARETPAGTVATTNVDHASLIATVAALADEGTATQTLEVDTNAEIDLDALRQLCSQGPCCLATSWVNGETGHIADVTAIAEALDDNGLFHIDAAQAVGRIPIDLSSHDGSLALSAHKFAGPKGIGAWICPRIGSQAIGALLTGGPQENGLRAGTENVACIAGMGTAARIAAETLAEERVRLGRLRDRAWSEISQAVPNCLRITPENGATNTLTFALRHIDADGVVVALDLDGFAVSTGSACAVGAPEPSHVITALGVAPEYSRGVIRVSLGRDNAEGDVVELAAALGRAVARAGSASSRAAIANEGGRA